MTIEKKYVIIKRSCLIVGSVGSAMAISWIYYWFVLSTLSICFKVLENTNFMNPETTGTPDDGLAFYVCSLAMMATIAFIGYVGYNILENIDAKTFKFLCFDGNTEYGIDKYGLIRDGERIPWNEKLCEKLTGHKIDDLIKK